MTNLTQSLAVEWADDSIRVNCLAPGLFPAEDRSGRGAATTSGVRNLATLPGRHAGEVQELGWAATYMCSPFAAYLTGHTMVPDGANWLRRYGLAMPEADVPREAFEKQMAARAKA